MFLWIVFLYVFVCAVFIHVDLYVCVCVRVHGCLGSQRLSEPEFDHTTAVVSKGGWGSLILWRVCASDFKQMKCKTHPPSHFHLMSPGAARGGATS